jgi:hypothetical protein
MLTSDPAPEVAPAGMLRKPRIQLPGELYHVISRGNSRKKISRSADDYLTSTETVASQKSKLPFYLYAYCLRIEELLSVAQRMSGLSREELCSNSKLRGTAAVKEAVIVLGRRGGIRDRELAAPLGLDPSAFTRRMEAARSRGKENAEVAKLEKALGERPR